MTSCHFISWKLFALHYQLFSNTMTVYRNVPFAYPLLIARNACRNEIPSLPCVNAKAHREGDWTSDQEISLHMNQKRIHFMLSNAEASTYHVFDTCWLISKGSLKTPKPASLPKLTYWDCVQRGGRSIPSTCFLLSKVAIYEEWRKLTFNRLDIIFKLLLRQVLSSEPVRDHQLPSLLQ